MNGWGSVESYGIEDLKLLALLVFLKMEQTVGRYRLKELLGMQQHEGIIRRVLEQLSRRGLVRPTRSGCSLTTEGRTYVDQSLRKRRIVDLREVDLRSMNVGPISVGAQVRPGGRARSLLSLRDEAVRAGADGAVILIHRDGDLVIPSVYGDCALSLASRYPAVLHDLSEKFAFDEGDMMVVGFADAISKALVGALAAALAVGGNETDI